ncbi:MAG: nucleotidyl transferase [Alphaproteobacteria bacterium]|nr:nucleotidyl transferase [Alphaproteobacteria bacterium]
MGTPVTSLSATGLAEIDIAILAGGLGTRIRGVLGDTPKVLAPITIGGWTRPFLDILLDWLARQGARRIVLCLGHLADRVERHLAQAPRRDLSIAQIVEPGPLGTAGALRFAGSRLASDPVMVINGDTFVDADLGAMLTHHCTTEANVTMLCARVTDAGRYGRVDIGADSMVRRFVEKDPKAGTGTINAGIYLLGRGVIDGIMGGTAASIERDVLERMPAGAIHAVITDGRFIDIGTPESLEAAPTVLAGQP